MPRFFFHLYDDIVSIDEDGRELADIKAARDVAVGEAREMMTETILAGRINFSHHIDVADETGALVATVVFRDAVTVEG
jgi:hypothetical protein